MFSSYRRWLISITYRHQVASYERGASCSSGFAVNVNTLRILSEECEPERLILFARAVSRPDEAIRVTSLAEAKPDMADMQTVVIVGSSRTRVISRDGSPIVYTPRFTPE